MPRPTTSSRPTWKACCKGDLPPRRFACGLQCQIDNFPPHQLVWGWRDFPHSEGHLAWLRTVGDVPSFWEGSNSHGLVPQTTQLCWLCPGVTRGLRQSYYDRLGEAKLGLLLIEPLRTQWTAVDFAPDNIYGLVAIVEHMQW